MNRTNPSIAVSPALEPAGPDLTATGPGVLPLAALALCTLLPALATSIANVALPTLAGAFAVPFSDVQWVVLAYLLAVMASLVSVGRLGDLLGRRHLLLAGIALFTLASAVCGIAGELWMLVVARALQGVGAAVMMALGLAFVGDAVPAARAGSAMGLLGTMSAAGTALGPTLGGVLIASAGWPAIFAVNVPLGLTAIALAWRYLPQDASNAAGTPARFDARGMVLLPLAIVVVVLGLTVGDQHWGLANVVLLAGAGLLAALLVWTERRTAAPLVPWSTLRERALASSLLTSALVATVVMATLVVGPFHLAVVLGLDAMAVGLAMSVGPLVAALAGVPAGRIVQRVGAAHAVVQGLLGMLAGCVALCVAPRALGVAGYVLPVAVLTASYALFQAANNTAVMVGAGPARRGVVSGLLNLSRYLGLVTGTAAMGGVFALVAGGLDVTATGGAGMDAGRVAAGMRATFALAAVLLAIALALVWRARATPAVGGAVAN